MCVLPEDDHFDALRLLFYNLPVDGHEMEYRAEDSDSFQAICENMVCMECQVHGEFDDGKLQKYGITAEGRSNLCSKIK